MSAVVLEEQQQQQRKPPSFAIARELASGGLSMMAASVSTIACCTCE